MPQIRPRDLRRPGWNPAAGPWIGLLLALPLIGFLVVFLFAPLILVVSQSLVEGGIAAYTDFFTSPVAIGALRRTLVSSAIVTALTLLFGATLAWRLRITQSYLMRTLIWVAILIPLWMGVIIKNYAFTILLGRGGFLSTIWGWLFHGEQITLLYTQGAVVTGVLYSMLPYAALPLYVTFRSIDLNLLAAAENLGATKMQALASVMLPLAKPGIVATGIIVFVISIGFYITPVLLGGVKSPYLPSLIEQDLFKYYDEESARVSATVLLLIATAIVALAMRFLGARQLQRAVG